MITESSQRSLGQAYVPAQSGKVSREWPFERAIEQTTETITLTLKQ